MVVMIYKLVKDTTLGDSFYREFYNTVDTYYSLYSLWKSEDSIDKAIQLLEQILYDVGISYLKTRKMASLNVPVQKSASVSTPRSDIVKSTSLSVVSSSSYDYFINYDYGPIEENIHKLFKINSKFALNLILDNYSKFKSNEKLQNIIWTVIKAFFPKPKDEVLLLLISQVRIKLIPLLTSIQDRKDIYYDIDSEKIIDNIRNDQFNFKSIKEIIDRLQAKVYVVNHNYKYHKINKYSGTRILYIFKDMFNTII
jgi:hypothetical protein